MIQQLLSEVNLINEILMQPLGNEYLFELREL